MAERDAKRGTHELHEVVVDEVADAGGGERLLLALGQEFLAGGIEVLFAAWRRKVWRGIWRWGVAVRFGEGADFRFELLEAGGWWDRVLEDRVLLDGAGETW